MIALCLLVGGLLVAGLIVNAIAAWANEPTIAEHVATALDTKRGPA